jgi:NAD(P)-dependent dehydrogenase (short-subunit alcohol dehydrogenase family)
MGAPTVNRPVGRDSSGIRSRTEGEHIVVFAPFDLTGRTALVTGGGTGIGFSLAQGLSQAGAHVVLWGRRPGPLQQAAERLTAEGGSVRTDTVDVSDREAVRAGIAAIVADGRLDAVFANAGIGRGGPFLDLQEADYRAVLATNLDGVVWTLQEAARHMVARAEAGDPGGSLVAISSLSAIEGAARSQAYAATKGALLSLTDAVAVEFARYGVRANAILPGWITTPLSEKSHETALFQERVLRRIPLRRWGRPADFAGLAVYLASDASAYHTGDTFVVDGGYTIF